MNVIKQIISNKWNIIKILIFVILFVFGISFLPKIGNNFDSYSEQAILLSNIKEYNKIFKNKELDNKLSYIDEISKSIEKDHGIAPYYPLTSVVLNLPYHKWINVWHMYTFVLFFIGVIFMYKLIKYLYKKENVAMVTTLLYFLSPRIFIDAFHNNKDIILMSFLVIMIYYGIKFINEKKVKDAILFGLISGILCNIKIIGLFFLFIIGFSYIINLFKTRQFNKRNFILGIIALFLSLSVWIILTPAIWVDSFNIIDFIDYCLKNAVDFRVKFSVFFEGSYYNSIIRPLPWYYLLKMMSITLPLIISLLFIISVFLIIINLFKKRNKCLFYLLIPFAIFIIINFIFIFFKPNIYNGWRHFYFLYGLIIIISSYIISYLINNKNKIIKFSSLFLVFVSLFYSIYCLKKYDVANAVYYNILMQKDNIEDKYELDYYGITTKAAILDFFRKTDIKYNSSEKIYIYGVGLDYWAIVNVLDYSNDNIIKKFELLNEKEFEMLLNQNEPIYMLHNTTSYRHLDTSSYNLVYSYKWFNSHVIDIYLVN